MKTPTSRSCGDPSTTTRIETHRRRAMRARRPGCGDPSTTTRIETSATIRIETSRNVSCGDPSTTTRIETPRSNRPRPCSGGCGDPSTTTRIETQPAEVRPSIVARVAVTHPRQQGLKLARHHDSRLRRTPVAVTHPRQQGLKLVTPTRSDQADPAGCGDPSTTTRIETDASSSLRSSSPIGVAVTHPRQQGLKRHEQPVIRPGRPEVAVTHPRQQGLKHRDEAAALRASSELR